MARYPNAVWKGDIPNRTIKGMIHPAQGLVLHIEQGSQAGTDGWFHNPIAKASAHFGIAKDGSVYQWVDTDDKAWAVAKGNPHWYSVENEGFAGQQLTAAQIESGANLFVWLSKLDGFPLQLTSDPAGKGLGHHSMGGLSWGGHACPGADIVNQKQAFLNRALQIAGNHPVPPPPTPLPPNPVTHLTLGGKPVARYMIQVTTDDQGNGYEPTTIPYDKVLAVTSHAPLYPPRDHRYGKMAKAGHHDEGNNLIVFVEGAEPRTVAYILVTTAD